MTPMEWLREKLYGHSRDIFREAMDATDDATNKARSLRAQLEPYSLEDDPFVAMTRKRLLAEDFARRQNMIGGAA